VLKKSTTPERKPAARHLIGFKCGDCLHHEKYPRYEQPCSKLGVTNKADAPECFTPNAFAFGSISPDVLCQLGLILNAFTASQQRVLLGILKNSNAFRKYGFAFGQPVFFHVGNDYLGNYCKGFVIGVVSHGEPLVFITSDLGSRKSKQPVTLALFPDSVISVTDFVKKRNQLVQQDKINDPALARKRKKAGLEKATPEYDPPTMESVPASWFDAYSKPRDDGKKKGKKELYTVKKLKDGTVEHIINPDYLKKSRG
jgi:hypothetical protein